MCKSQKYLANKGMDHMADILLAFDRPRNPKHLVSIGKTTEGLSDGLVIERPKNGFCIEELPEDLDEASRAEQIQRTHEANATFFQEHEASLAMTYPDSYVAVSGGKVIGHDSDFDRLFDFVRANWPLMVVYIDRPFNAGTADTVVNGFLA